MQEVFAENISRAPADSQVELHRLLGWARHLEADGLAVLYTSTGKDRWVLNPRFPGAERGLLVVYNERGPSVCPWRTVWAQEAPRTLERVEAELAPLGQGRALKDRSDHALGLLRHGYEEVGRAKASGHGFAHR